MELNLPEKVRGIIYTTGVLGQPIMVYCVDKGWFGTPEMALWGALSAAAFLLARINLGTTPKVKP